VNLVLLAGAFLLSIVSFRVIENPIRRAPLNRPILTSAMLWGISLGLVALVTALNLRSIAVTAAANEVAPTGPLPTLNSSPADPKGAAIPAVVAAVRAARRGSPIPRSLIPPLEHLLDGRYPPIPDCWGLRQDPDDLDKCTLFAGGATGTIVLIGDSHAREWLPAISWMAKRDGWTVVPLLHMGCWPASFGDGGECQTFVRWAERQVRTLRPDVVLIGGELRFVSPQSIRMSANGIGGLVAGVRSSAQHVAVIGDPPARGVQPVDCLLARGATLAKCTWTLTADQISVYQDAERAATHGGAAFLDTIGWFCFQKQCPTVVGRTVTYRENDHISQSYATELRRLFRAAFIRAVSGGATQDLNALRDEGVDGEAGTDEGAQRCPSLERLLKRARCGWGVR
jgi:hypothetical protein